MNLLQKLKFTLEVFFFWPKPCCWCGNKVDKPIPMKKGIYRKDGHVTCLECWGNRRIWPPNICKIRGNHE